MDWQKRFSSKDATFGNDQSENIEAINRYIVNATINTKEAGKIRDEWIRWHDKQGWWSLSMTSSTYDEARNIRNRFNIANAKTAEDKEFVRHVQQQGLSSEEMQGGTKRVLSDGTYSTDDEGLIPTSFKLGVGVTLGTLAAGYVAWKLYVPDLKGWMKRL